MLEEASQAHSVICEMCLLSNDDNVVFSPLRVHLQQLFSVHPDHQSSVPRFATGAAGPGEYLHERNTHHPQAYNHNLYSLAAGSWILLPILFGVMTIDGRPSGLHARRRVGPRHGQVVFDAPVNEKMVKVRQTLLSSRIEDVGQSNKCSMTPTIQDMQLQDVQQREMKVPELKQVCAAGKVTNVFSAIARAVVPRGNPRDREAKLINVHDEQWGMGFGRPRHQDAKIQIKLPCYSLERGHRDGQRYYRLSRWKRNESCFSSASSFFTGSRVLR